MLSKEEITLSQVRLLAAMLVLGLAVGCKAQSATQAASDPALARRVEILVRNTFGLAPDIDISLGARLPSQFSGYETLPIVLSHNSKTQVVNFLISTDGTKLIRQDTFDLTKDPADAIPIDGRPMRGNPDAKVTVVNFDDLECPFCARMHQELFPATLDHYKGLVRVVYKDDPLTDIHPWAMRAAVDANCLAAQNGDIYWTYVDYLHGHADDVTGENRDPAKSFAALDRIARQEATLGKLDEKTLDACLKKQDETQVQASVKLAESLELEGTPALVVNGEKVNAGAVPQDQLWTAIDRALRAAGEQPPMPPKPPESKPAAGQPPAAAAPPTGQAQGAQAPPATPSGLSSTVK